MGRDSDHPLAPGEVGRVGVAIDSLDDMRRLLAGLPLDSISTSMTINATAATLLALYIAVAEEQGVPAATAARHHPERHPQGVHRARHVHLPAGALASGSSATSSRSPGRTVPSWNTISISGYHMREAGCDAVQEVAFTLADGIAYVEAAVKAGLDVDGFGAQLSFFFNGHNNLLEEVAKFRAARRLWSGIMADRFGAKTDRARALRFHCQTAGMTLLAQQPMVNVVRVALQALAAVLGRLPVAPHQQLRRGARAAHRRGRRRSRCARSR